MSQPLVIAHRGNSSVAPENTLVAFASALLAGVDLIEVDLRPDADGAGVILHDASVDRTSNGSGEAGDLGSAEIARLDAGSWLDGAYAGARVPSWQDALAFFAQRPGARMLLELKAPWETDQLKAALTEIDEAGVADRVIAQSFYPDVLKQVREISPHLPRGFLTSTLDERILPLCAELGVMACNPAVPAVLERPEWIGEIQAAGLQAMVWTANEPAQWATLVGLGVDGIITDRPDRLAGWLSAQAA